jgi:hypothetical protein
MGSLSEDRLREAMAIWRRRERWSYKDGPEAERLSDKALQELTFVCEPEIEEAIRVFEEKGGCLFLDTVHYTGAMGAIVRKGVLRAAQSLRNKLGRNLLEYVKACVEEVLWEITAERKAKLERCRPDKLQEFLLLVPREVAASQLMLLGSEKRLELLEHLAQHLLHHSSEERVVLEFTPDREPEDKLLFLIWSLSMLASQHIKRSIQSSSTGDQVTTAISARGLSPSKNEQGEPINPIGPIFVRVADVLTGLPSNRIPASARSKKRLGISFGVNRGVIKRWKDHPEWEDLQVDIRPDGKGGVYWTFDLEALLRSIRIVKGEKRGRPPKNPY